MIPSPTIAVVFLLRWEDAGWRAHARRFLASYAAFDAGVGHRLYIALKGFDTEAAVAEAAVLCAAVPHVPVVVEEAGRDIGAYLTMSRRIDEPRVCFLNSHSQILCDGWLLKLDRNLDAPGVGLVGATGSYESLHVIDPDFPAFPNPHLRTNGFMLDVALLHAITADVAIEGRRDAFMFESGALSMTNRVLARDLRVLTVGRNGRGYDIDWWPWSDGFRQGRQTNLLVGDNQTRHFDALQRPERDLLAGQSWGVYRSRSTLPGWRTQKRPAIG